VRIFGLVFFLPVGANAKIKAHQPGDRAAAAGTTGLLHGLAFRHNHDKLAESIAGFSKALVNLEAMLARRITESEKQPEPAIA
jgi:hypothetical protein